MTLRARLAVAFFAVVLGPVAIGAYLLWSLFAAPVAAPGSVVASTRPSAGLIAVRTALAAQCAHLDALARGLAVESAASGHTFSVTPNEAAGPWLTCASTGDGLFEEPVIAAPPGTQYAGIAGRAEIRDGDGILTGYAYAVRALDGDYLAELSAVAGEPVTLLDVGSPAAAAGLALPLGIVGATPISAEPAPAGPPEPGPATGWLAAVAVTAVAVSAGLGWWLAALATRPLDVLLRAVERVVAGDLTARSRLAGRTETGRLGTGLDLLIAGMQETRQLSVTDPLTGLGNVRQLGDALRREVERASRFGRALGVLALDLDHFKAVNDRYGHRAGDTVLMECSQRVRRVVREVDLAFRRGGEEFVILLPETDVAGSLTAARRIGEAIRDEVFLVADHRSDGAETAISVTVSIGVAVYPRHALTGPDVLDIADTALYTAKDAGRDTFALAGALAAEPAAGGPPAVRALRPAGPIPAPARSTPPPTLPPAFPPTVMLAEAGGASGGTTSPRTSPGG